MEILPSSVCKQIDFDKCPFVIPYHVIHNSLGLILTVRADLP